MTSPQTLIGGTFALPDFDRNGSSGRPDQPFFLAPPHVSLANARSALCVLARSLKPRTAWLPSYLCESVVQALVAAGVPHRFYPVPYNLSAFEENFLPDIAPGDLVVVIDYFGFPADREFLRAIKAGGAYVVEDAAQALLTDGVGRNADFVIYSPRKFVGVPDAGILINNAGTELGSLSFDRPPAAWWSEAFSARQLRRDADRYGQTGDWHELFQRSETSAPCGAVDMSDFSQAALSFAFDYSEIAAQRRANYQCLLEHLAHLALFPVLPVGVVPLGFPIRVENRDMVRQTLFAEKIYPPVHWPLDGVVPASFQESHRLSGEVLTLVCDQRYNAADMERTASILLRCAEPVAEPVG